MEEAELNTYPIGLISSEIHVNISFLNNIKTLFLNWSNWTYIRRFHVPQLNGDLFPWTGIFFSN